MRHLTRASDNGCQGSEPASRPAQPAAHLATMPEPRFLPAFLKLILFYGKAERMQGNSRHVAEEAKLALELLEVPGGSATWANPREQELRTSELHRFALQRKGWRVRGASRVLGLTEDALGHDLRGAARLTFFQVFGVLHYIGMGPRRFFFELFLDPPQEPEEWHPRAELLDLIETLTGSTARGLLQRIAREEQLSVAEKVDEKPAEHEAGRQALSVSARGVAAWRSSASISSI